MKRLDQYFGAAGPKRLRRREEYQRKEGELADVTGVTSGNLKEKVPRWNKNYNLWLVEQARYRGFRHQRAFTQKRLHALIAHFEQLLAADNEMRRSLDEIREEASRTEARQFQEAETQAREEAERSRARQEAQFAEAQQNMRNIEPPANVPAPVLDVEAEMEEEQLREALAVEIEREKSRRKKVAISYDRSVYEKSRTYPRLLNHEVLHYVSTLQYAALDDEFVRPPFPGSGGSVGSCGRNSCRRTLEVRNEVHCAQES
eukprot:Hpha_TRINITY_DN12434_c0_g1::TRINITY_DN12434_c0_g1_i1::g.42636::m.42636